MGNWYQIIVDRDVTEAEAPRLAEEMRVWLIEREIIKSVPSEHFLNESESMYRPGPAYQSTLEEPNPCTETVKGLKLVVGRTVFYRLCLELTCKACGARLSDEDESWDLEPWHDAIEAWWSGDASAVYACPKCGVPERLTEWSGDAPWYFGYLGLKFWDWAPLSERFIQEVTKQLGHRTGVVYDKL